MASWQKTAAKSAQIAVASLLLLLSIALLSTVFYKKATDLDFIGYWTSARLLRQHANPYSRAAILHTEHNAGGENSVPIVMRNPPWALFLVAPLGFFSLPFAAFLWLLGMIVAAVASIRLLAAGSKPPPVAAYLFAPILYCAMSGQTPLFILLGIALFLYFHDRRPWLAGLALILAAVKPHLFLLFWPVLLLDCLTRRRFRLLGGAVAGLAIATAIALAFDHRVLADYLASMRSEHMELHYMNNLPCTLRFLFPSRPAWVQAVPAAVALPWACWYYWRRRAAWNWMDQGAFLLCISVLVSPYSWPCDQVLFLPAILRVCSAQLPKSAVTVLVALSALAAVLILRIPLTSPAYVWTGPAWLLWYLWARRKIAVPASGEPVLASS